MSSTKVFILVEEGGFYKGLWPFKYIDNLELPVHRPKVSPPFSLAFWFLPFSIYYLGRYQFQALWQSPQKKEARRGNFA